MSQTCKYYKMIKQVSYDSGQTWSNVSPAEYKTGELYESDSASCGGEPTLYRWGYLDPFEDYYCSGTTKYFKKVYQISYDGGENWYNIEPENYEVGHAFEIDSEDCGGSPSTSGEYLTFTALEDGTYFGFRRDEYLHTSAGTVEYSVDSGNTWTRFTDFKYGVTTVINSGDTMLWRSKGININTRLSDGIPGIGKFISNKKFNVSGNILSMSVRDTFEFDYNKPASGHFRGLFRGCGVVDASKLYLPRYVSDKCYKDLFWECSYLTAPPKLSIASLKIYQDNGVVLDADACFEGMFRECTSLTTAPLLPAFELGSNCYRYMFSGCTSLGTTPELPAEILGNGCYEEMFNDCISLTTAQNTLPATTLKYRCYYGMFRGCISLTTAPILPALYLPQYAYYEMFRGARNLNYVKSMALDVPGSTYNYTNNWLYGVSSTGTFVKNANSTWTRGSSGIPNGWTIETVTS